MTSDPAHAPTPDRGLRLLVAGDLHGAWGPVDRRVAALLEGGHFAFVGDLGEEDDRIVERILADLPEAAVVLGNHDVARSAGRETPLPRLERMLRLLGDGHLAYRARPLGDTHVLVGARPYSSGGDYARGEALLRALHGVASEVDSARAIVAAAEAWPDREVVVLAHNGPTGLGADAAAPFGRDFRDPPVDHGDADLGAALDELVSRGRRVPLVLAGHMHERLRSGGLRRRAGLRGETLVINTAVVPRHARWRGRAAVHLVAVDLLPGQRPQVRDLRLGEDGVLLGSTVLA